MISWNFLAVGVGFACSGMFQALGDTLPGFYSSASRLVTFAMPCVLLSYYPPAVLPDFWVASIISATVQAGLSLWFLREVFRNKLGALPVRGEFGLGEAVGAGGGQE